MATTTIEKITQKARRIAAKKDRIRPGQTVRFPGAASIDDCIRQGDLYLTLIDRVPDGYAESPHPKVQLVPGTTEGSRHCLDSHDCVVLYYPPNWGQADSLLGPVFVATGDVTVLHPRHGHVEIPAGCTIRCDYQREYDAELRRERRNAD